MSAVIRPALIAGALLALTAVGCERHVPPTDAEIDRAISSCLTTSWRLKRIDSILRALLRAAAWELMARHDVPARVVIDEYIEIARRFDATEECAFVNAVLDRLARRERASEFAAADDEPRD